MEQLKYMDQGDAFKVGWDWLSDIAQNHGATRIDPLNHCQQDGCAYSAWVERRVLAYFLVVRDPYNWTVLLRQSFVDDPYLSAYTNPEVTHEATLR